MSWVMSLSLCDNKPRSQKSTCSLGVQWSKKCNGREIFALFTTLRWPFLMSICTRGYMSTIWSDGVCGLITFLMRLTHVLCVLGTKLIFSKLIFADYPFTVKSLTNSVFYRVLKVSTYVRRDTMLPKQCVYRPKQ
eukprot:UN26922